MPPWNETPTPRVRGFKRVLNTGSGPADNGRLHPCFAAPQWHAVRLDIDPAVQPDLVGRIEDMRDIVPDQSFDAVWSSHSLEHLFSHDVVPALREFTRILKDDGFAMITCPDLEAVASALLETGLETPVYMSAAGPISVVDMIFGHRASIAAGNVYMAHRTGFTAETLGAAALAAGFAEVRVGQGQAYDLWAIAAMPDARMDELAAMLRNTSEAFLIPQ